MFYCYTFRFVLLITNLFYLFYCHSSNQILSFDIHVAKNGEKQTQKSRFQRKSHFFVPEQRKTEQRLFSVRFLVSTCHVATCTRCYTQRTSLIEIQHTCRLFAPQSATEFCCNWKNNSKLLYIVHYRCISRGAVASELWRDPAKCRSTQEYMLNVEIIAISTPSGSSSAKQAIQPFFRLPIALVQTYSNT